MEGSPRMVVSYFTKVSTTAPLFLRKKSNEIYIQMEILWYTNIRGLKNKGHLKTWIEQSATKPDIES